MGARNKSGPTKGDAVHALLLAHPRLPIADIAKEVYPGVDDATHKVRAALFALKSKGRVRNVGTGLWEAVPTS
jgi:hypothetical protein